MFSPWETNKPLESFFGRLAGLRVVQIALRQSFGKGTGAILAKLKKGEPLLDNDLEAHDIIADLVDNNSEVVAGLYRHGQKDENNERVRACNIMRFGVRGHYVYWIEEAEGGSCGYFGSMKAAKDYADLMYVA
jgi:hypothetical protein